MRDSHSNYGLKRGLRGIPTPQSTPLVDWDATSLLENDVYLAACRW